MSEIEEGKHRMYADFSNESYAAYQNGDAVFNNGFRAVNGTYMPDQPEFVEIEEENEEDAPAENNNESSDTGKAVITTAVISVAATYAVVKIAPHVKKWWNDKAAPEIKKKWNKITKKDSAD